MNAPSEGKKGATSLNLTFHKGDTSDGRMAVLKDWRGRGIGRALLGVLLELAAQRGLARVTLSAQTHTIGFYERAGFRPIGDLFLDAGITHRKMERELERTQ
ncbi:MAG: GNAT family acetyltransferase YjcF [Nitrospira sp.]|jgi:predicted GNAT family N-acyltransferase|nr:MAG: GNAT family acetyltransferase YjcF [Nitrospira sp.]